MCYLPTEEISVVLGAKEADRIYRTNQSASSALPSSWTAILLRQRSEPGLNIVGPDLLSNAPPYPTTDEYGTAWAMTAFTNADTTTNLQLAWPNSFVDYTAKYSWEGVLPTTDIAGAEDCAWATPEPSTRQLGDLSNEHRVYPHLRTWSKALESFQANLAFVASHYERLSMWWRTIRPSILPSRQWQPLVVVNGSLRPVLHRPPSTLHSISSTIRPPSASTLSRQRGLCFPSDRNQTNITGIYTAFPTGTEVAPYWQPGAFGFGDAFIVPAVADIQGGTTTFSRDGPHTATRTRDPITRGDDRVGIMYSRAG